MKVLMVCSGGFSSTIVVNAIKKEADKQGLPIEIIACDKINLPVEQIPLNAYTPLGAPKIINEIIKKYMD